MIVNRRTFAVKPGSMKKLVELLKKAKAKSDFPGTVRLYVPVLAPFDVLAIEWEFEDWDQYHKHWAESDPGEKFWEKWLAGVAGGGTNEVWRLVE